GFGRGPLATIVFWRPKKKQLAPIRVTLVEVSSTTGATLLADSRVSGYPSSDAALGVVRAARQTTGSSASAPVPPHIDSISPRSGDVDAESVLEVVLYGRGFGGEQTVVMFDAAMVERPVP